MKQKNLQFRLELTHEFGHNGPHLLSWIRTGLFVNHSYEHLNKKFGIHKYPVISEKNVRILLVLMIVCKCMHSDSKLTYAD